MIIAVLAALIAIFSAGEAIYNFDRYLKAREIANSKNVAAAFHNISNMHYDRALRCIQTLMLCLFVMALCLLING